MNKISHVLDQNDNWSLQNTYTLYLGVRCETPDTLFCGLPLASSIYNCNTAPTGTVKNICSILLIDEV